MPVAVLDTVYLVLASKTENTGGKDLEGYPGFSVVGGTANVYVSFEDEEPANAAAMVLDEKSPIADGKVISLTGRPKWILFETDTGTPEIQTQGLIVA